MKAIVCVKEVAETPDGVRLTDGGFLTVKEDASFLIDPIGPYAVETALQLRDTKGGEVVALCAGTARAVRILKESALAMGVNDAYLISDEAITGSDPHATAIVLAAAIKKIGGADLILCGDRAADDNAAIVGPALAVHLGIPVLSYVDEILDFDPEGGKIKVARALESGREIVEASLPIVLTVMKGIHEPRYPSLLGIRKAAKREVPVWTAAELGLDPTALGAAGSPTFVRRLDSPPAPSGVEVFEGEPEEIVSTLTGKIMNAGIL